MFDTLNNVIGRKRGIDPKDFNPKLHYGFSNGKKGLLTRGSLTQGSLNRTLNKEELSELMVKISRSEEHREVEVHFNRLYDSVVRPLWASLSGKYVPPLTFDDLKDIFQEAWIKLLEQRTSYDGTGDVFNWIYTIKKNLIIDKIRKMKRYIHTSIDEQDEDDEGSSTRGSLTQRRDFQIHSYDKSVEDKIVQEEQTVLLRDTLNNIQDDTIRELLKRRIIMDQKLEFISQDMGIPLTTVHKKIKKGLSLIKPIVENILTT